MGWAAGAVGCGTVVVAGGRAVLVGTDGCVVLGGADVVVGAVVVDVLLDVVVEGGDELGVEVGLEVGLEVDDVVVVVVVVVVAGAGLDDVAVGRRVVAGGGTYLVAGCLPFTLPGSGSLATGCPFSAAFMYSAQIVAGTAPP